MLRRRLPVGVFARALAALAMLSFSLPFAPLLSAASPAGAPSPQSIIAALRRNPAFLPMVPDFVHYVKGRQEPVSQYDRDHGVIAYFTVAADYEDASATNGIAYRIFQDNATAEKYSGEMFAMNNPKIMGALGSDIDTVIHNDVKDDAPWRGRQPFKDLVCETYISTRTERLETARCYAQHLDLPAIVSGIRIVPVSAALSKTDAKRQFGDAERQKLIDFAILLLDAGMARVEQIETDGH